MLNDILCNPVAYRNGYSICVHPLCVLEYWKMGRGRAQECYTRFVTCAVADLRGARGTRAPLPRWSKFFQFHAVLGKLGKFRMLAPPWGVDAPSSGKSWIRHWCVWSGTVYCLRAFALNWTFHTANCRSVLHIEDHTHHLLFTIFI